TPRRGARCAGADARAGQHHARSSGRVMEDRRGIMEQAANTEARMSVKKSAWMLVGVLAAGLALAACDKTKVPLPGERVSVLQLNTELNADPTLADVAVRLPKPYVNDGWAQVGGNPTHAMYHLQAGADVLTEVWSADI